MRFIHRATDLQDSDPKTDRSIFADGDYIARVYQYQHGPQQGLWGWFGQWPAENNVGMEATLQHALKAVKQRYLTLDQRY